MTAHLSTTSWLTSDRVRKLYHYDPISGDFTYRVSRGCRKTGDEVGWLARGYRRVKLRGKSYGCYNTLEMAKVVADKVHSLVLNKELVDGARA